MIDLAFLPLLYIWTDASKLSYVKLLSYAEDLIPDICGQHLNNSELHKYILNSYVYKFILANASIF